MPPATSIHRRSIRTRPGNMVICGITGRMRELRAIMVSLGTMWLAAWLLVLCGCAQAFPFPGATGRRAGWRPLQYSVRIVNKKGTVDKTFEVERGKMILDVAEENGVELAYSCRAGACSTCVGRIKSGMVDQSSQVFLSEEQVRLFDNLRGVLPYGVDSLLIECPQLQQGFVLTCSATPLSDLEIETDVEEDLY